MEKRKRCGVDEAYYSKIERKIRPKRGIKKNVHPPKPSGTERWMEVSFGLSKSSDRVFYNDAFTYFSIAMKCVDE